MRTAFCVAPALLFCLAAAATAQEIRFDPMPSGLSGRLGFYIPQRLDLSEKPPATLKNPPKNLRWPLYGVLPVGNKTNRKLIYIVLDSDGPDSPRARLWVDAEGSGDFSSVQPADWKGHDEKTKEGVSYTEYQGGAMIDIGKRGNPFPAHFGMYVSDPREPGPEEFKHSLFYYSDYARTAKMPIGAKSYDVILIDRFATGDFSNQTQPSATNGSGSSIRLYIDRNGDGKIAATEKYEVAKPFAIDGGTYQLTDISPSGDRATLRRSSQTVAELPVPPDYEVGKPVLPFAADDLDGKTVHFPRDYKGKIVALDFWATWCGPCMAQEPDLVAAFEKYHGQGLEVLGVSLDAAADRAKLVETAQRLRMSWPEIYDGKEWDGELVQKYGISSIPAMFLVDGDTGLILAQDKSLDSDSMAGTIKKALEQKGLLKATN